MDDNEILKALGNAIRSERIRLGRSQENFAFDCGVHRTYLGSIERGERNVSMQNLYKISQALGITTAKLMEIARL